MNRIPGDRPILLRQDIPIPRLSDARWDYWRPDADGIVELGMLGGCEVGLPTHFHDEDQVTFVLQGRRRFLVGGKTVDLGTGQAVLIPAGVPHASLPEPSGVRCMNAYLPAGGTGLARVAADVERLLRTSAPLRAAALPGEIRQQDRDAGGLARHPVEWAPMGLREPVARVAARAGMSREGFSRRFAARCGMPPHAFWLMGRLNRARALLRAGEALAEVAFETGFADQSHLTRCFRRAFGVTPGRFRAGRAPV